MKIPKLTIKIWLVFSLTLILYSLLQFIIMSSQMNKIAKKDFLEMSASSSGTITWTKNNNSAMSPEGILGNLDFPPALIEKIKKEINLQQRKEAEYSWSSSLEEVFYTITKKTINLETSISLRYLLSDFYKTSDIFLNGLEYSIITLIIMLIPASFVTINLVRPILKMKDHALRIAKGNLQEPITIKRKDEVGELGYSLELMRNQIYHQDLSRQKFFQSTSHELQTPIMVIRSHIEAIEDGVGEITENFMIIKNESEKLEIKVKKLLSFSKMNYLVSMPRGKLPFAINLLLTETISKLKKNRKEVTWNLNLEQIIFSGNKDLLTVLFENILDNQIRYAKTEVTILLYKEEKKLVLNISNDGETVPPENLSLIFEMFFKGRNGSSGLGLSIVKEICLFYGGTVFAENKNGKTCFVLCFPL